MTLREFVLACICVAIGAFGVAGIVNGCSAGNLLLAFPFVLVWALYVFVTWAGSTGHLRGMIWA